MIGCDRMAKAKRGSAGGLKRKEVLSVKRRKEIASMGGKAFWAKLKAAGYVADKLA